MSERCAWCGRFVPTGTAPIAGINARGDRLDQILCAECAPGWVDLSARNVERLIAGPA